MNVLFPENAIEDEDEDAHKTVRKVLHPIQIVSLGGEHEECDADDEVQLEQLNHLGVDVEEILDDELDYDAEYFWLELHQHLQEREAVHQEYDQLAVVHCTEPSDIQGEIHEVVLKV